MNWEPLKPPQVLIIAAENSALAQISYRIPLSYLSKSEIEWRFVPEAYLQRTNLTATDLLVLSRCCSNTTLAMARIARRRGIKILYELDDDLLRPPQDEEWGRRYQQSLRPQLIKLFLDEADLIKAGSPELAQRLQEEGYQAVYHPYAVELQPFRPERPAPPYRIGYFGTKHHRSDIEAIFPALIEVRAALGKRVAFEFIGCFPEQWKQLGDVSIRPVIPGYREFLQVLANSGWNLGLAPLRPHPFNEAKSDSKFRDLSAAGIVGIYADLPPYRGSVRSGVNGWLCETKPQAWYEMIRTALNTPFRPMLESARAQLFKDNHPKVVAQQWLSLYRSYFYNR